MAPEFGTFITMILSIFITAAVPTLVVVATKLAQAKWEEIKHYLSADQILLFESAAKTTLQALQQSGAAGLIENTGQAKKEEAVIRLQAIVDANKWNIPVSQIESTIEAGILKGWNLAQEKK